LEWLDSAPVKPPYINTQPSHTAAWPPVTPPAPSHTAAWPPVTLIAPRA